ncbi:hypothetical protein ACF09J_07620 [Streptomyces sp. NPDC014889]|uniref:hypothetical protein n=1 Tax=Streptomyces sp. NPDC014889 TaxID=3364928 RepID=UPI0036FA4953
MPLKADKLPPDIKSLGTKVARMERRLNERDAARRLESATVGAGGLRINGGAFAAYYPGVPAAIFATGRWGDGSYGSALRRNNGTLAMQVEGSGADTPGMIRLYNRQGTPIIMDDAYADGYLGRPWVPIPMQSGVNFTGTTWQPTHLGRMWAQHAVLHIGISVWAPSGSTAQARVAIAANNNTTPVTPVISSTGGNETFGEYRLTPSQHGMAWGDVCTIIIQGQRTAGTGTCTMWCQGIWGSNTYSAAEAL